MFCKMCDCELKDGDTAFEQAWDWTEVSGKTVTQTTVLVVVCERCA